MSAKEPKKKTLEQLDLHESIYLEPGCSVMRVPSGFVYTFFTYEGGRLDPAAAVFVPAPGLPEVTR